MFSRWCVLAVILLKCNVEASDVLTPVKERIGAASSQVTDRVFGVQASPGKSTPPRPPPPPPPPPSPPPPLNACFAERGWGDRGEGFRGSVSTTRTGRRCQPWARQYPHAHAFDVQLGTDTALVSNFCRNPTEGEVLREAPWCYTTDPAVRFELCDVCSAKEMLLRRVSAPHVHAPVPQWVGPLCLAFSATVLVGVLGYVLWRIYGGECGSACEEMAFGRRMAQGAAAMRGAARPSGPPRGTAQMTAAPQPGGGGNTTSEATFSTLAGLARLNQQQAAQAGGGANKTTANLSLLEHDSEDQRNVV